jgi:hypothetical protein
MPVDVLSSSIAPDNAGYHTEMGGDGGDIATTLPFAAG